MATPVLPEELLLLIIDNVPATHELLALRLAARNLNRLVLNKFHKLTGQREVCLRDQPTDLTASTTSISTYY